MNADRLFALYDRVADAPDAIARLRRFVLDLAVRGKLVEQDPADEPAAELLKRIVEEKTRLVKAGLLRRAKKDPELSGDDPFELPQNWVWVAFGELHNLVRGVTYSKSDVSEEVFEGFIPIVRANNIGVSLSHGNPVYVKRDRVSPDQMLRRGDFLIALSSGSKNLVGKAAYVPDDFDEAFGGFCGVVRLYDLHLSGFVDVYLQSDLYRKSIAAGSRGIGINNLKKEVLSNLYFPLPPLVEQRHIVAKVDELMALCDRLEKARAAREEMRDGLTKANLARLSAADTDDVTFRSYARFTVDALPALTARADQVKHLRQAILNLAVRGKLVEQDPGEEPASELLRRLAAEKARLVKQGRPKKSKVWPSLDPEDAPFDLPTGWSWARFPELGVFGRGKSKHRPRNDPILYVDGTYPMVQTGDVARSKGVISTYTNKYNATGLAQSMLWPRGTLCITIAANIADSGILAFDACFPDSLVGLVPTSMFKNGRYFGVFHENCQGRPFGIRALDCAEKHQPWHLGDDSNPTPSPRRAAPYRGEGR